MKESLLNEKEFEISLITFGSAVQLRHIQSGLLLTLLEETSQLGAPTLRLVLALGNANSNFKIIPKDNLRTIGEGVFYGEQFVLKTSIRGTTNFYLDGRPFKSQEKEEFKVRVSEQLAGWEAKLFMNYKLNKKEYEDKIKVGDVFQIYNIENDSLLFSEKTFDKKVRKMYYDFIF